MSEFRQPVSTPPKLYSERQVSVGASLGGPIAGGWMMRQNFSSVGEPGRSNKAFFVSLLFTFALFAVLSIAPTDTPNSIGILPIALFFWLWYRKTFASRYENAIQKGGTKYSAWKVFFVCLATFPATLAISIGTYFVVPFDPINNVSYAQNRIYYEGAATKADAYALLARLKITTVFTNESAGDVTLVIPRNNNNRVTIKLYSEQFPAEDAKVYSELAEIRKYLEATIYRDKNDVRIVFVSFWGTTVRTIAGNDAVT